MSSRDPPASGSDASALCYRSVLEKATAGLAVLDLEGIFHEVNPALCELTGYAREALSAPGFSLERLFLPEEVPAYRRHMATLSRGDEETYRQPQQLVRQDSVIVWVDLAIKLLRNHGGAPHRLVLTAVDITEQKRVEDSFRNMSFRDPLTKLPNRRLLHDRLQTAVARAKRDQRSIALLFVDLDQFKPINDTLGHKTGDWLLKAVAGRLVACLREYDTAARFGGDEFVVLLPDLAQREDVLRVAERIRAALAAPFVTDDGRELGISASIGVSLYPDHADSERDLLQASDEAMYLAKRSGRNQIAYSHRTPTPDAVPVAPNDSSSSLIHLTWEASFASGNAFIDAEHRELFRQSNQLLDLATRVSVRPDDVRAALLRLVRSVESHFRHEERILHEVGYPGREAHAARHHRLQEYAEGLYRRSTNGAIPVGDIVGFLVADVIHGHVLTEDRDYFPQLAGREGT